MNAYIFSLHLHMPALTSIFFYGIQPAVPSIHAYMGLGDPAVLLTMATLMDAAAALTARSHWPRLPASATCRRWHAASAQQGFFLEMEGGLAFVSLAY